MAVSFRLDDGPGLGIKLRALAGLKHGRNKGVPGFSAIPMKSVSLASGGTPILIFYIYNFKISCERIK